MYCYATCSGCATSSRRRSESTGSGQQSACLSVLEASYNNCLTCNIDCQDNLVSMTRSYTKPVAVAILVFWLFFVLTALVNNHVIALHPDEDDDMKWNESIPTLWKFAVFLFDGIVILLAFAMVIVGLVGFFQLKKEENCPLLKVGKNCNVISTGFLMVTFVGLGLLATSTLIILGIVVSLKLMLRVANIVFVGLCFVLLILTIMVGLATGALGSSVTQFNENYETMRNDIRKISDRDEFKYFCATPCDDDSSCTNIPETGYDNKDAEECKEDVKDKVESYMTTIGITVAAICGFLVAILFFTNLAIGIWKSNEENDEIGEVGADE